MIITSANMVVSVTTVAICLSSKMLSGLTLLLSEGMIFNLIGSVSPLLEMIVFKVCLLCTFDG